MSTDTPSLLTTRIDQQTTSCTVHCLARPRYLPGPPWASTRHPRRTHRPPAYDLIDHLADHLLPSPSFLSPVPSNSRSSRLSLPRASSLKPLERPRALLPRALAQAPQDPSLARTRPGRTLPCSSRPALVAKCCAVDLFSCFGVTHVSCVVCTLRAARRTPRRLARRLARPESHVTEIRTQLTARFIH